jgi:hypothetical protein
VTVPQQQLAALCLGDYQYAGCHAHKRVCLSLGHKLRATERNFFLFPKHKYVGGSRECECVTVYSEHEGFCGTIRSFKGNDQNPISVNCSVGYDVDVSDHPVHDVMLT